MTTDYKHTIFTAAWFSEYLRTISKWQRDTFPKVTPKAALGKFEKEVNEFADLLLSGDIPRHEDLCDEAADVFIVLVQVCDALGVDLKEAVDRKMQINFKRDWVIAEDGTGQHVKGND